MSLKVFTDKNSNNPVSINPSHVTYVEESEEGTRIFIGERVIIVVTDTYLDTVARLNEV